MGEVSRADNGALEEVAAFVCDSIDRVGQTAAAGMASFAVLWRRHAARRHEAEAVRDIESAAHPTESIANIRALSLSVLPSDRIVRSGLAGPGASMSGAVQTGGYL